MTHEILRTNPDRRGSGRTALRLARAHRRVLTGGVVATTAASILSIVGAVLVGRLTDAALRGDGDRAVLLGVLGVACAVVQVASQGCGAAWLARAGEYIVRDLRDTMAHRLVLAPLRFVERHRAGELLQRGTAEVAALSMFVRESLSQLVITLGTLAVSVVVLAVESWQLLLAMLVAFLPVSWLLMARFRHGAGPAFAAEAAADAQVMAGAAEIVRTREVLWQARPDGMRHWRARFDAYGREALSAQMRTVRVSRWVNAMSVVEGLSLAALLVVGARLVDADIVSVGVVVTFVLAGRTMFAGFSDLSALLGDFEEAATGAARAHDLLAVTGASPRSGAGDPRGPAVLRATGVRFGYGDVMVLDRVDLELGPGDRVCLVGRTGSGKSTLAKLLAGLYTPDAGSVTFAGVELSSLDHRARARAVAYVPQQVQLGTGTLRDELVLVAPEASDAELSEAAERLGLGPWLSGLEAGLDTLVDRDLSAGERQVVGLVRVALLDAPVLVLDEATSDLDPHTAQLVEAALDRLAAGRAVVVVAHRQATVDAFDVVYDVAAVLRRV